MEETTPFSIYPTQFSTANYDLKNPIVFWEIAIAWLVLNLTMICVVVIFLLFILQTTITVIRRYCLGKEDKALAKQATTSTAAMKNRQRIYLPRPSLKNSLKMRRSQSFSSGDVDGIIKKDGVGIIDGEDFWERYLTRDNIPQEYYDDYQDFLELRRNTGREYEYVDETKGMEKSRGNSDATSFSSDPFQFKENTPIWKRAGHAVYGILRASNNKIPIIKVES
ncbi:unnamed protein product [Orchesella dallaii]|uniref:Uncharacterized protein n=1 Tax=Orchesella dallaii TaxID=48710 RepID=A0ABP1RVF2_9HEXA